jgi:hypothetical protein
MNYRKLINNIQRIQTEDKTMNNPVYIDYVNTLKLMRQQGKSPKMSPVEKNILDEFDKKKYNDFTDTELQNEFLFVNSAIEAEKRGSNAIDEEKDNGPDASQSHIENNKVSNAIKDAIQSLLDTLPLYVKNNEEEYYRNKYREKHKNDMEQQQVEQQQVEQQVEHKDGGDQGGGKTQKKKKKKPKGVLRQRTIKNKFRY